MDDLDNNLLNSYKAFTGSHFMLNALNTIQSEILLRKDSDAFQAIQVFTRLYKHALRSSNDHHLEFAEEINFIHQYLKMEHLRFNEGKFPRLINHSAVPDDLSVPTYLLQSFLENALLVNRELPLSNLTVRVEYVRPMVRCIMDISGKPEHTYHPKVQEKTRLAEERINLLNAVHNEGHRLIWGGKAFCTLELNGIN